VKEWNEEVVKQKIKNKKGEKGSEKEGGEPVKDD
jgi:hypothetical protein